MFSSLLYWKLDLLISGCCHVEHQNFFLFPMRLVIRIKVFHVYCGNVFVIPRRQTNQHTVVAEWKSESSEFLSDELKLFIKLYFLLFSSQTAIVSWRDLQVIYPNHGHGTNIEQHTASSTASKKYTQSTVEQSVKNTENNGNGGYYIARLPM